MGKKKTPDKIIQISTDKSVVSKGTACTRIVEVSITAPEIDQEQSPLELAVVIDRSGSMHGEKLHYAKQAAAHLIDLLTENDRAAVVMYDTEIDVVSPSLIMNTGNRESVKTAIQSISSRGSTNLFDGWLQGCHEIAITGQEKYFKRTLLLSDGLANQGTTNPQEICTHVRELAARDISTSCFGIGLHYNEHLLEAMANAGGGNFHFLEAMSAIPLTFEREFDELIHTAFSSAELSLNLPEGTGCTISAGWPATQTGNTFHADIGSLYGGREMFFYFQLKFANDLTTKKVHIPISFEAKDAAGKSISINSQIDFLIGKSSEEQAAKTNQKLLERFALVDMADRATEALKLAREGRRDEATQYLGQSMRRHSASMTTENRRKYEFMSNKIYSGMDELAYKRHHQEEYLNKKTRVSVQDFRLREINGHMVANIGGKHALVDSGIPVSLGHTDEWYFMEQLNPLSQGYLSVDIDQISRLIGSPIDIMMGADILKQFCVLFELPLQRISFSLRSMSPSRHTFPLTELMGVPALNVDIRGRSQKALLDTGAKLSYLVGSLVDGLQPVGREEDFYPGLGAFETDVFEIPMSLGDVAFTLRCGILPSFLETTLQVAGKQAIIGTAFFSQFRVELDMRHQILSIL